jgi:hypothetical protein
MKTVLVEKYGIYVEDLVGNSVGFSGINDVIKYTGIDLTTIIGDDRITYHPDRGINSWFDGINTTDKTLPNATFDELIDNVVLYASRKSDPYYMVELDTAKDIKKGEIAIMMANYSYQPLLFEGHNYKVDIANILPTYTVVSNKDILDTSWTVKWTTEDVDVNGVSVRIVHSVVSFKALAETLFARNEAYFQIAADKKDLVSALTSIEDVKNFDISTGW